MLNLKTARRIKGLTQVELATAAGVDQRTISALEKGRAKVPTWDTAWRLARALGVEPQELFDVPELPTEQQAEAR